jgi:hypothetical protein
MKTFITTVAATLFATAASAADVYRGFEQGNPDLASGVASSAISASQPGVGSGFDRYHGWADGNPDLFVGRVASTPMGHSAPADVYRGWADGNPDL